MANSKVKFKTPRQTKATPWGNENSPGILSLPQDIIRFADGDNWESLFRQYMIIEVTCKGKKKTGETEYVWAPSVMEEFIRAIVKKLKNKKDVTVRRSIKRNK